MKVAASSGASIRDWGRQLAKGRPWWVIAAPAAVTLLALVLYTWSLSRNGMANSYYAAAVKSATVSWKAFLFGSLDPGSFITVDKPPAAIWVMAVFCRVFGFSSWSMLIPQALAGAGSVLVLHRLVRRWKGEVAALLAALGLALTPVATLIFRYNNPDAFLTLLLLLATWTFWSALEKGSTRWSVATGVLLGFAFLTKMLMGLMVVPAFALVYLLFGPPKLGRRLLQMLVAFGAILVSGGWWLALVELWPEASRPHVGGTVTDSWIDLILSRSAGVLETTSQGANLSGEPGWLRIVGDQLGGQIAWLLPLALAGLIAGLAINVRTKRTDRSRAGYFLWGVWTLVMIVVFSAASGTMHSYYTVVLAPGVAALAGAGSVELWRLGRSRRWLSWVLPVAVVGTAALSAAMLGRVDDYVPGLGTAVLALGVVGAVGLLVDALLPGAAGFGTGAWRSRSWRVAVVTVSLVAVLAGPFAFSASTVARPVTGNTPVAGPLTGGPNAVRSEGSDLETDEALLAYLDQNRGDTTYLVAVQTTTQSVPIILATGEPVVTIGGYKSRDPYPTVSELEGLVEDGRLRYVLLSGSGNVGLGTTASRQTLKAVIEWIEENGAVVDASDYGGTGEDTLYLLGR